MCATDDPYTRQAIMRQLRSDFPQYDAEIVRNWPGICQGGAVPAAPVAAAAPVDTVAQADAEEMAAAPVVAAGSDLDGAIPSVLGFSGQVEAGLSIQSGNTEATELNLQASGEQELQNWRHHFKAKAFNSKEEGVRTDEEYRLGFGSDWKINARDYLYGQVDYVNDRYAGYTYRISESLGAGRRWIDDGVYLLDTRIGPGMRHTEFTSGDHEDSWIILGALRAGWVVNDYVELGEDAGVEYSPDGTILNSDSWAKSKLTEDLALKAGFNVEHKTAAPPGAENTDTRTMLGVVYGF